MWEYILCFMTASRTQAEAHSKILKGRPSTSMSLFLVSGDYPPDIFPPMNRPTLAEITVMSPTSIYKLHYFNQSCFHLNKECVSSNVRVNKVSFLVSSIIISRFCNTAKIFSLVQLLVNKELFHQSSFYFINIVSSVHLLFKQRYLHFSRGEKSRGECPGRNVLDPCQQLRESAILDSG